MSIDKLQLVCNWSVEAYICLTILRLKEPGLMCPILLLAFPKSTCLYFVSENSSTCTSI
jgi:hypothetical protein